MRKLLITLIVLVTLGTAAVWSYQNFFQQADEPQQEWDKLVIERGTLLATVNATGTVLPEKQTTLSFRSPGRVDRVWVKEGQFVTQDEVLAQLETRDLEYAVAQARLALATAQAQLLRLQRPPSDEDIAAAEAALSSAQALSSTPSTGPPSSHARSIRLSKSSVVSPYLKPALAHLMTTSYLGRGTRMYISVSGIGSAAQYSAINSGVHVHSKAGSP